MEIGLALLAAASIAAAVLLAPEIALPELVKYPRWRKADSGRGDLIGLQGRVLPDSQAGDPKLWVLVRGERWQATSTGDPLPSGTTIRVVGIDGMTLRVAAASDPSHQGAPAPSWTWLTPRRQAGLVLWAVACLISLWAFSSLIPGLLMAPCIVAVLWLGSVLFVSGGQ